MIYLYPDQRVNALEYYVNHAHNTLLAATKELLHVAKDVLINSLHVHNKKCTVVLTKTFVPFVTGLCKLHSYLLTILS